MIAAVNANAPNSVSCTDAERTARYELRRTRLPSPTLRTVPLCARGPCPGASASGIRRVRSSPPRRGSSRSRAWAERETRTGRSAREDGPAPTEQPEHDAHDECECYADTGHREPDSTAATSAAISATARSRMQRQWPNGHCMGP
jgi:hypothetical protein